MAGGCTFNLLILAVTMLVCFYSLFSPVLGHIGEQPLSKIAIHKAAPAFHDSASISASPLLLGLKGEDTEWVSVELEYPNPSDDDWVGVFSPAKFNGSSCPPENKMDEIPYICSAPIKYKYANYSSPDYTKTGKASLKFRLINQRADISFALFAGGLLNPKLVALSNSIIFANPKAPLYPRLAQGKAWDEVSLFCSSVVPTF
ncbi:hypothetical protein SAY86_014617 [Trapa natans]|uniref:Purple acid phosphatase Fn3-like domain-containing protein n=1 Tax=Trapa natans TaxID=22666 RepID=A0AAN7KMP4_TRANT|nr:hypothetical protein SAY86_014617 [Trapa natans]